MKTYVLWLVLITILLSCTSPEKPSSPDAFLDQWHRDAATGQFENYFAAFESDASIFMGTDATERWTIAEFKPWAKPYFEDGMAWDFTPFNRHLFYAEKGNMLWFDEELETPNLGVCRGTGVMEWKNGRWRIHHYNLAIAIPNDLLPTLVPMLDSLKTSK